MWKRLADAASAASRRAVAWRLEELQPPRERVLFDFARGEHGMMAAWRVYADDIYGGSSTATLAHSTSGNAEPAGSGRERLGMSSNDRGHEHGHEHGHDAMRGSDGADGRTDGGGMTHVSSKPRDVRRQHRHIAPPSSFVVFSGSLSSQLQEEPEDQGGGAHASCQHDLDAFSSLHLLMRGDGRTYLTTLRTEGWVGGPAGSEENTWQAFLPSPRGQWRVVKIPLSSYSLTWKGRVVGGGGGRRDWGRDRGGVGGAGRMQMNARRVVGMGVSVNVSTPPVHSTATAAIHPDLSTSPFAGTTASSEPSGAEGAAAAGSGAAGAGDAGADDSSSAAADIFSDAFPSHGEGPFRLEVAWVKAVRDGA
ncbi:hypothetical protein CLOM_g22450 [Closterium sp. NIES-68]|nr:hypothetical protein CLOM_g22450 [Closterium sp. NIES-68]GJP70200.1 hypothetical protein CLOP_g1170 [Closterium sp. NIES-67]